MRTIVHVSLSCFILFVSITGASPGPASPQESKTVAPSSMGEKFGKDLSDARILPVKDVLDRPEAFEGKTVKLEGTILEVCQAEGCWLTLGEGDSRITVNMERHSFFVPKDSSGRHVIVEGKIIRRVMSEEEIEHREAEGAASLKGGAKPGAPKVSLEARAVLISTK